MVEENMVEATRRGLPPRSLDVGSSSSSSEGFSNNVLADGRERVRINRGGTNGDGVVLYFPDGGAELASGVFGD